MMKAEFQLCADTQLTFRHCVQRLHLQIWIMSYKFQLDFWNSSVRASYFGNKFPLFCVFPSLLNLKDCFFILTDFYTYLYTLVFFIQF